MTWGTTQETELGSVTIYGVDFPVAPQDRSAARMRTKGTDLAVADIKVCSNGQETGDGHQYTPSDFALTDDEWRAYLYWPVEIGARAPNLTSALSGAMKDGECHRGWLTFELVPGSRIKTAAYLSDTGKPLLEWADRP